MREVAEHINGFHRYLLSEDGKDHLIYAAASLGAMLGMEAAALVCEDEDSYLDLVYPADRPRYTEFLNRLRKGDVSASTEYRLVRGDGRLLEVRDQASSWRGRDEAGQNVVFCDSVLTDITDLKKENENLRFLHEAVSCGFLKYTCEKQPKITYLNQEMREILGFPKMQEQEAQDFYRENIFLMIPIEERRRFSMYLHKVRLAKAPVAGEMTLLRCDGTRAYVFGWVSLTVTADGTEEFQSICIDITERQRKRRSREIKKYLKAISDVYDRIFAFDLSLGTVRCVHSSDAEEIRRIGDVPMRMEEGIETWLLDEVRPEDAARVGAFFDAFQRKGLYTPGAKPPQIEYRAQREPDRVCVRNGVFLKIDDAVSLYCCRTKKEEALTDGVAAFEVTSDEMVIPLYISENLCEFFGYTREAWLRMMHEKTPVEQFIAGSEATYADFERLLRNGEARFRYFDYQTEQTRTVQAVCSQKYPSETSPRYVMLYQDVCAAGSANLKRHEAAAAEKKPIVLRTFGYFDVFVGDRPVPFRNKKSKELLAILTDRRGGFVSSEEAIGFLWEDEPISPVILSRYRKVALRLKNTLEEYGIADIVENVDGKRRIVPEAVSCDLFDYLSGKEEASALFKGSYLTNYSWGETTLGELSLAMK